MHWKLLILICCWGRFGKPIRGAVHVGAATSSTILAAWEEVEAFLDDERRMLKLLEACAKQWSGNPDDPIMDAVNLVFESTGEKDVYLDSLGRDIGHARMLPEAASRILARAGLLTDPLALDPLAFIDRDGKLRLSYAVAVQMAGCTDNCCSLEPQDRADSPSSPVLI